MFSIFLTLQYFIAARQLAYGVEMKGSGPKQFNADLDLAKISAFSFPWMPVWLGVQAIVTSLSLPNIFRFLMHVNIVLDFTTLFWIARIAAWLFTKIIIFFICNSFHD